MGEHNTGVVTGDECPASATTQPDDRIDPEIFGEVLMLLEDEAPDGLMKVSDLFRSGMADHFVDIDAALADGRFDEGARASHSLRGSAGTFGARRLSSLGTRLEQLCHESDGPTAVLLVEEMRVEFLAFLAILDTRLAALSR